MRRYVAAGLAVLTLVVFSGRDSDVIAQQPAITPIGRFQVVASPSNPQAMVLLDTQTGRTWMACSVKGDSTLARRTSVETNWCAMHLIGTAPRP